MDLLTENDEAGCYPASYYAHVTPELATYPSATGEIRSDVCVIGGGFTGLSAAYHLARAGYRVCLLEAQRVGFGASGRNGGQVGTGQRLDQDELERIAGRDDAHKLWDLSLEAVDLVRGFASDFGIAFHDGILHADHKKRFVAHSHAYAEKLAADYGYERIQPLDRAQMRELVGSDAYHGGALDLGSGHLNPLALALGLANAAEKAGADIYENARVTSLTEAGTVTIRTETAKVTADHAVLACNGYLQALQPQVQARVMPINNFIVATEPLSAPQKTGLINGNFAVADSKFVINYFRFSEDDRLLFGGSESYGYRFPRDIAAKVRKPMLEIFPQLQNVRTDFAWGGTLAITMNRLPHFARIGANVLSLSGYSGHGVALATLGGKIAAETIQGQAERFDLMEHLPTTKFPGGAALRSPLLALAMLWFSLRDRL